MINTKLSDQELLIRLKDPRFYLENFCKIKTKKGGLNPFVLKESQKDLFNALFTHNRVILLKARQLGMSTAVTGYLYHQTIMNPGTNTALIGYNAELTTELLDKVKTFWKTTPEELRPTLHYNSKHEISFPKIDSKIIVLPSTENVGRGYTLHRVLCTELSAWDRAEDKMMSLEASVPVEGKIIIESTPRGTGNLYHRMWVNDKSDYLKKEYGWWWEYTEEEIDKIRRRMNDEQSFAQEYGLEFLTSGRPVFDQKMVRELRKGILNVGDDVPGTNYKVTEIEGLRIYKQPDEKKLYVLGADVSEGVNGGDYSVVPIIDRMTGEEVAFYRGLIAPDRLGSMINKWGRMYNNALAVVEVNNHGLTTLTALKNLSYPALYYRPKQFETIGMSYTDKLGWRTTKLTRTLLIDDLAQAIREKTLIIHSKEILDEMTTFVYNVNNEMVPQQSFHDDGIFGLGIGYQGFKVLYSGVLSQIDTESIPHVNYFS